MTRKNSYGNFVRNLKKYKLTRNLICKVVYIDGEVVYGWFKKIK